MLGAIFFQIAVGAARGHSPEIRRGVEAAADDSAAQQHLASELADFLRARFPHHSRAQSRIAEGVNERLHYLFAVFGLMREKPCLMAEPSDRP